MVLSYNPQLRRMVNSIQEVADAFANVSKQVPISESFKQTHRVEDALDVLKEFKIERNKRMYSKQDIIAAQDAAEIVMRYIQQHPDVYYYYKNFFDTERWDKLFSNKNRLLDEAIDNIRYVKEYIDKHPLITSLVINL